MTRSTLIGSDHPTLFLIKKRRSTDATGCFLSKKLFVKIPQYSPENNCAEVSFK